MQPSRELRRIAVIGAGSAGRDFALRCVRAGFEVTLEDVMPSRLRSAEQLIKSPGAPFVTAPGAPGELARGGESSRVGSNDRSSGALHLASTVEDAVRDAELAIDFVPDELESKLEIFSMLDRMAPPRTILCTPSTALSIADLASCTYRPQLCFALRFPNANAAEIVYTSRSSRETLSAVEHWLTAIGFTVATEQDAAELASSTNKPDTQS